MPTQTRSPSHVCRIDRIDHDNPQTSVVTVRLAGTRRPTFVKGPAPALKPGMSIDIVGGRQTSESTLSCTLMRPAWPDGVAETARALHDGRLGRLGSAAAWRLAQQMGRLSMDVLASAEPNRIAARYGIQDPDLARTCRIARSVAAARKALDQALARGYTAPEAALLLRGHGAEGALAILNGQTPPPKAEAGRPPSRPDVSAERGNLMRHIERAARQGHCALPASRLVRPDAPKSLARALDGLLDRGDLTGTDGLIQLPGTARQETELAQAVADLNGRAAPIETHLRPAAIAAGQRAAGVHLSDDQARALTTLIGAPVSVLTGGPGTGKSALTRAVIAALVHAGLAVTLAAPTGKAARRLADATGQPAETLHRTLGLKPNSTRRNRIDTDVLVIDECSMIDLELAVETMRALGPKTRLILVGDADQLPSVGPGQVLADVIESGVVPVARLTQVHRQDPDSGIVGAARAVNAGRLPDLTPRRDGEVFFLPADGAQQTAALAVDLAARRLPAAYGLEPLEDVQTLAAMRKRDACGTRDLNAALQARLVDRTRPGLEVCDGVLRAGDRAIQTVNDPALGLVNGDSGLVIRAEPDEGVRLELADGRRVDIPAGQARRLAPAHALTVHKSQGSEYPAVVMPITPGQGALLTRRMVYTALTRAKGVAVLLGCRKTLQAAIRQDGDARITGLVARLRDADRARRPAMDTETERAAA